MKNIQYTAEATGFLDCRVPDVGLAFNKGEIKPVTDEQAEILLKNKDFIEVGSDYKPVLQPSDEIEVSDHLSNES